MNNDTGIYSITSPSGGIYVGSAVSFRKRWNEHRRELRTGRHHSKPLQSAFLKYGEGSLIFAPIVLCLVPELLFLEQRYIDKLQPKYNVCKVAGSRLGTKQSPETLAKVSAALTGRKHSVETRNKISAAQKGCLRGPLPDSTRTKISEALKGNTNNFGRPPASAETRAKLSVAGMGKPRPKSEEQCAKISLSLTGKILSPETRAKLSAVRKGVPKSPEHRAKMAMAQQQRRQAERVHQAN